MFVLLCQLWRICVCVSISVCSCAHVGVFKCVLKTNEHNALNINCKNWVPDYTAEDSTAEDSTAELYLTATFPTVCGPG